MPNLRPIKFGLNLRTVLWGGEKIASLKRLDTLHGRTIGESWEICGITGHESVVATGDDAGLTLRQLISRYRGRLVGNRVYRQHGNEFPLLVKFIDARDDLSVQVHPGDDLAMERHGCSGKTEMWYIIDTDADATIAVGTCRPMNSEDFKESLADNSIANRLRHYGTNVGDCFFLPAGTLHSIGSGNLLLEVQQASDITYRVWDFNRRDGNGQPRPLHTRLAIDAIDYARLTADCRVDYNRQRPSALLVDSPFFTVERVILDGSRVETLTMPHDAFLIVTNVCGEAVIVADSVEVTLAQGETTLLPAETAAVTARGKATLILATV